MTGSLAGWDGGLEKSRGRLGPGINAPVGACHRSQDRETERPGAAAGPRIDRWRFADLFCGFEMIAVILVGIGGRLLVFDTLGQECRQRDLDGFGIVLVNEHCFIRPRNPDLLLDFIGSIAQHLGEPSAAVV